MSKGETPLECKRRKAREATKAWYKKRGREHARVYMSMRQKRMDQFKIGPCTDCFSCFPPECMDFDHVRGNKNYEISKMTSYSLERVQEEIAKCDLVCANCHRIRTRKRRQHSE